MPAYTTRRAGHFYAWATPLDAESAPVMIIITHPDGVRTHTRHWPDLRPPIPEMPGGGAPGVPVTCDLYFNLPAGTVIETHNDHARLAVAEIRGAVVYDSAASEPVEAVVPKPRSGADDSPPRGDAS